MNLTDDITIEDSVENIATISGNIEVIDCEGNYLETISGNILISSSNYISVKTLSGDIDIHHSDITDISSLSGNISISNSKVDTISCLSGSVNILNSEVNEVHCTKLGRVDGSTISKIVIYGSNKEVYKGKISKTWTNEIHLPCTSRVKEIEFKEYGTVYSPYRIITNGNFNLN